MPSHLCRGAALFGLYGTDEAARSRRRNRNGENHPPPLIFRATMFFTQSAHKLLREDDDVAYGDSRYIGIEKRDEIKNNEHFSKSDFRINRRPKSLPQVSDHAIDWERYIENRKSAVRCKVEHAFKMIKDTFGFRKVRY